MTKKIKVSGVGCCLVDLLYNNISFSSPSFSSYISKKRGDGGLTPGQLVFTSEFEKFSGHDFQVVMNDLTKGKPADKINIGGPGIVALIHASQMLENTDCEIRFYGGYGNDKDGILLKDLLNKTPVNMDNYILVEGVTPSTVVLSDPDFNNGSGERIFINSIGAAGNYLPEYLDDDFFSSDVVVFGGTALVPSIHDELTELLVRAKSEGCITVVNTVFDFRNEKANPDKKWPLGKSDKSYRNIDLLITNMDEALRLSGKASLTEALEFFMKHGTGAVLVTNGAKNVNLVSDKESIFYKSESAEMPVSAAITTELNKGHVGDTTGCGDNFAGGVIANLVSQLQSGSAILNLKEACIWGIISGGFSCFYMGGTYFQDTPGEKRKLMIPFYEEYIKQLNNE
ncbi:MAG TPA: carbohydrate kinase family protein [Draconibacterium sp.]|nr:carbohydrate kinase family protein [Draconibacterium sp.]